MVNRQAEVVNLEGQNEVFKVENDKAKAVKFEVVKVLEVKFEGVKVEVLKVQEVKLE